METFILVPPLVHHEMHTSFAEMHFFQADDGQHLGDPDHLWLMLRALRKNQVSFWLTLLLPIPVSITHGSSLWLRTLDYPAFSAASCEVFTGTASRMWNSREQTEDNSLWSEVWDKVVQRAAFFLRWPSTPSLDGSKRQLFQGTLIIWTSCSLRNVLLLTTSLWLPHPLVAWWLRWHQHFIPWITLLSSIWTIAHAAGLKRAPNNVILCGLESRRVAQSSVRCKLFDTPNMLVPRLAQMDTFIVGQQIEKFIQRVLKINASTKSLAERLCDFKIHAISVLGFIGSVLHLIRQPSRSRTMLFSAQQQARTTLYRLPFLELAPNVVLVLTWWVFTPWALRLAIELQHARPHLAEALKRSIRLVDTIALLFWLFLPSGRKNFLFLLWPTAPRMLLMLFVVWTVISHLMMFHKKTSRRLLLDYFLTNSINKTLLDLSPVAPRKSWDRSVVIVLLTSCSTWKLVSRASRLGLIVGFLRILRSGLCTAQRFHTEEHDHTCRVGCPNEPDSLTHSHITMSVPGCTTFFTSFWRHSTVLSQRNHFSTTWSLECSCGAFNMESW